MIFTEDEYMTWVDTQRQLKGYSYRISSELLADATPDDLVAYGLAEHHPTAAGESQRYWTEATTFRELEDAAMAIESAQVL